MNSEDDAEAQREAARQHIRQMVERGEVINPIQWLAERRAQPKVREKIDALDTDTRSHMNDALDRVQREYEETGSVSEEAISEFAQRVHWMPEFIPAFPDYLRRVHEMYMLKPTPELRPDPKELAVMVEEQRKRRDQFLVTLYELSKGALNWHVRPDEIADRMGVERDVVEELGRQLVQAGLVGAVGGPQFFLKIPGQRRAEELIAPLPNPVSHPAIQATYNAPVGAVQYGDGNTAQVVQQVNPAMHELASLLDAFRSAAGSLPEAQRKALLGHEEDIREELKKRTPKLSRLASYMESAGKIIGAVEKSAPALYAAWEKLSSSVLHHFPNLPWP